MSSEIWSIITVGIVILIAIATSNRSLRREMSERINGVQRELGGRIDGLSARIDAVQQELSARIDGVQRELSGRIDAVQRELSGRIDGMSERLGDVRERLGRLEGLEGIGTLQRKRAGKGRGDENHDPAPRSKP